MRDVAFCLVENEKGEVLFVQRAYGKEKAYASGRCLAASWTVVRAILQPSRRLPGDQTKSATASNPVRRVTQSSSRNIPLLLSNYPKFWDQVEQKIGQSRLFVQSPKNH